MALASLSLAAAVGLTAIVASSVSAQDWQVQQIDHGTKPALAVTPEGRPVIVYMLERMDGWVRVASLGDTDWQVDEIANGYFYGPPDIAIGADGVVHAAYHDHQGQQFDPGKGDAVYARREGDDWTLTIAADPGHDGWDNRITTDAAGAPHMVGVDPLEFDGSGVEYYSRNEDGSWSVEQLGTGPQTYKYAVSVAVSADGTPWVSYHDGSTDTLNLAHPTSEGWQIETVDDEGETGFFSELAMDGDDGLHISYFERLSDTSGTVKHAYRESPAADWQLSAVDQLDAVLTGFTGARNITSIDLDADGNPWIVYSDESVMKLSRRVDGEWQTEVVVEAGDEPLGQIVSLKLDGDDRPHIAYADVTDKGQLDGSIWYTTRD